MVAVKAETTVTGLKYLRRIFDLLKRLDSPDSLSSKRDRAGNRKLQFSHYAGLILLGMFNPTLQSLRGLQELTRLKRVQKCLGSSKTSLGSLSESVRVFDPALLEPLITELAGQIPSGRRGSHVSIPDDLARRLTAVDGSVLRIRPQLVAAGSGADLCDRRGIRTIRLVSTNCRRALGLRVPRAKTSGRGAGNSSALGAGGRRGNRE